MSSSHKHQTIIVDSDNRALAFSIGHLLTRYLSSGMIGTLDYIDCQRDLIPSLRIELEAGEDSLFGDFVSNLRTSFPFLDKRIHVYKSYCLIGGLS